MTWGIIPLVSGQLLSSHSYHLSMECALFKFITQTKSCSGSESVSVSCGGGGTLPRGGSDEAIN